MESFHNKLGFSTNPFAFTNADEEELLSDYFVPPPFFDAVVGDINSPNSTVVLAPRGGGKSAQRRMMEIWSQDHPVLAVTYDRFEFGVGQKITDIGLPYHIRNIITRILLTLLTVCSDKPEVLKSLEANKKKNLSILCHNYLGKMTGQSVSEAMASIKSIPERIKEFWSKNVGFLEPVINIILKHFDIESIDLPELKQEEKKLESTYKYQLELIREIVNDLGYKAIYHISGQS